MSIIYSYLCAVAGESLQSGSSLAAVTDVLEKRVAEDRLQPRHFQFATGVLNLPGIMCPTSGLASDATIVTDSLAVHTDVLPDGTKVTSLQLKIWCLLVSHVRELDLEFSVRNVLSLLNKEALCSPYLVAEKAILMELFRIFLCMTPEQFRTIRNNLEQGNESLSGVLSNLSAPTTTPESTSELPVPRSDGNSPVTYDGIVGAEVAFLISVIGHPSPGASEQQLNDLVDLAFSSQLINSQQQKLARAVIQLPDFLGPEGFQFDQTVLVNPPIRSKDRRLGNRRVTKLQFELWDILTNRATSLDLKLPVVQALQLLEVSLQHPKATAVERSLYLAFLTSLLNLSLGTLNDRTTVAEDIRDRPLKSFFVEPEASTRSVSPACSLLVDGTPEEWRFLVKLLNQPLDGLTHTEVRAIINTTYTAKGISNKQRTFALDLLDLLEFMTGQAGTGPGCSLKHAPQIGFTYASLANRRVFAYQSMCWNLLTTYVPKIVITKKLSYVISKIKSDQKAIRETSEQDLLFLLLRLSLSLPQSFLTDTSTHQRKLDSFLTAMPRWTQHILSTARVQTSEAGPSSVHPDSETVSEDHSAFSGPTSPDQTTSASTEAANSSSSQITTPISPNVFRAPAPVEKRVIPKTFDYSVVTSGSLQSIWRNGSFLGLCSVLNEEPMSFQLKYSLVKRDFEGAFPGEATFFSHRFKKEDIKVSAVHMNFINGLYVRRPGIAKAFPTGYERHSIAELHNLGSPLKTGSHTADDRVHHSMLSLNYLVEDITKRMKMALLDNPAAALHKLNDPDSDVRKDFQKADILSPLTLVRSVFGELDDLPGLTRPILKFGGVNSVSIFNKNPHNLPRMWLNAYAEGNITAYIIDAKEIPELERRAWDRLPETANKPATPKGIFDSGDYALGLKGLLGEVSERTGMEFKVWSCFLAPGDAVLIPVGCYAMAHFHSSAILLQQSFTTLTAFGTPYVLPTADFIQCMLGADHFLEAQLVKHRKYICKNPRFHSANTGYNVTPLMTVGGDGTIMRCWEDQPTTLFNDDINIGMDDEEPSQTDTTSVEDSSSFCDEHESITSDPVPPASPQRRNSTDISELVSSQPGPSKRARFDDAASSVASSHSGRARICPICSTERTSEPATFKTLKTFKQHYENRHPAIFCSTEYFGPKPFGRREPEDMARGWTKLKEDYDRSFLNPDQDLSGCYPDDTQN